MRDFLIALLTQLIENKRLGKKREAAHYARKAILYSMAFVLAIMFIVNTIKLMEGAG